jgi:hypothetical protein
VGKDRDSSRGMPRARMTEQEIEQDRNCHYDLQSSIVSVLALGQCRIFEAA